MFRNVFGKLEDKLNGQRDEEKEKTRVLFMASHRSSIV